MIVHSKTPNVRCRCSKCKEQGTHGTYIGTQAKRGSVIFWYCLRCWGAMQAILTGEQMRARVRC